MVEANFNFFWYSVKRISSSPIIWIFFSLVLWFFVREEAGRKLMNKTYLTSRFEFFCGFERFPKIKKNLFDFTRRLLCGLIIITFFIPKGWKIKNATAIYNSKLYECFFFSLFPERKQQQVSAHLHTHRILQFIIPHSPSSSFFFVIFSYSGCLSRRMEQEKTAESAKYKTRS